MRFVEWSCGGAVDRTFPLLTELGCDLAVMCEVPEAGPASMSSAPAVDWHWVGDVPSQGGTPPKGLALASFGGALTGLDDRAGRGSMAIAAEDPSGTGLLGIWSCPPEGATYGAQVTNTISAYADWLRDTPSIVAGDFNVAPFGSEDARSKVLSKLFAQLEGLGYRSVYHHFFEEEYGSETRSTYFHQRNETATFHIDFCFLHTSLLPQVKAVELGTYDGWVARVGDLTGSSDHVPLIVDLDI